MPWLRQQPSLLCSDLVHPDSENVVTGRRLGDHPLHFSSHFIHKRELKPILGKSLASTKSPGDNLPSRKNARITGLFPGTGAWRDQAGLAPCSSGPSSQTPSGKDLCPGFHPLSLPTRQASNFTPDTCSAKPSMGSAMGNRRVGRSWGKGRGPAVKHKGARPPARAPGVAVAPAEPQQDTHPREQRHRRARTEPALQGPAAPQPKWPVSEAGGGRPPARPRPFFRPALGQGQGQAAGRTPLLGSLYPAALTPLHPRRARPC